MTVTVRSAGLIESVADALQFILVGPVDPVGEEVVGPAGPTTATQMDKFTRMRLDQGLLAIVGRRSGGGE